VSDERLDARDLDADERALVEAIAARRDEIVELACTLVGFDTQARAGIDVPPRQEGALAQAPGSTNSVATGLKTVPVGNPPGMVTV